MPSKLIYRGNVLTNMPKVFLSFLLLPLWIVAIIASLSMLTLLNKNKKALMKNVEDLIPSFLIKARTSLAETLNSLLIVL